MPPLRGDAPGRAARGRGSVPDLSTRALRRQALERLAADVYSASAGKVVEARLRTVATLMRAWGEEPLPPTAAKMRHLCASLKAGGYRSAEAYVSAYRMLAERSGYSLTDDNGAWAPP